MLSAISITQALLLFVVNKACITEFHVEKNTWASSDSERDYDWTLKLIPSITSQDTSKFIQGKCGKQSKLEFAYTCWKIHHPQTYQHPESNLAISDIEDTFSSKLQNMVKNYDAFMDFNFGFWVPSLDAYLTLYQVFIFIFFVCFLFSHKSLHLSLHNPCFLFICFAWLLHIHLGIGSGILAIRMVITGTN